MSQSEAVKAEVKAVRDLRNAVIRYAERMRDAMAGARRDAAALLKRAEENLQQRKARMDRAMRELQQARAALAACRDPRRAAAQQCAVAEAKAHADETRQACVRAQQAVRIAAAAQSDLLKTMQSLEAVVGEHSSVSSSALASLEGKLAEIDVGGSVGHGIVHGLKAAAVTADLLRMSFHVGEGTIAPVYQTTAERFTSMSQVLDEKAAHLQQDWGDNDLEQREEHSGEVPGP